MNPDILTLGEPMAEFTETEPHTFVQRVAGDIMNVAVCAARQGTSVGCLTRLGADRFGDRVIELLTVEGVETGGIIRDPTAPTGIYFIAHDADGHHFSYYRHGSAASRMTPADLDTDMLESCRLLHVSGISQAISESACDTVTEAIRIVRAAGGRVSYDTNLRLQLWDIETARTTIHAAMADVDIALPGFDDAIHLTGLNSPQAIADFYLGLGPTTVALTLGKDGTLIATPERREMVEAFPVDAIDAAGAGDCFDGAFLAEITAGRDPFQAARYANAAAALSTQGYGALEPVPTRAAVEGFLAGRG